MDDSKLKEEVSRKREAYIRQLEEQLAVYEEKDKAQELLIEKLQDVLDLFAGEISRLKEEKKKDMQKGE